MNNRFCSLFFILLTTNMAFAEPIAATLPMVFPIMDPKVSSNYGIRKHPILRAVRHHSGIDLAVPENSHVRSVAPGVVIFADKYAKYGKLVTIKHENGFTSLYGHLKEIRVNPGEKVPAGAIIGRVGQTGGATGPHLHFEWRQHGKAIDPIKVLPGLTEVAEG